jgi:hypothetical protein
MAGHSRSKNGVASLAYVPAIHAFGSFGCIKDVDARAERGHDGNVNQAERAPAPFTPA